jgi:hypothetical protein
MTPRRELLCSLLSPIQYTEATKAPGAGKLDTGAMERVALLRTCGHRLLHRCRRGRPVVQATAVSSSVRRLPVTSSSLAIAGGYSLIFTGVRVDLSAKSNISVR